MPTDAVISSDDCVEGCLRRFLKDEAIRESFIATGDPFEWRGYYEQSQSKRYPIQSQRLDCEAQAQLTILAERSGDNSCLAKKRILIYG